MKTQRGKTRTVIVGCALATLSGLSLMAWAGDRAFYGGSIDYSTVAASDTILAPSATAAAAYIKFDGVEGEAQDRDYENWSHMISFSQGLFFDPGPGPGGFRGRAVFEDVLVTKQLDKASPKLAEAVAQGRVFPTVEIHWTKIVPSGNHMPYYTYELRNVQVVGYHIGASAMSDTVPTEEMSLNFEEIKVTYTEVDAAGRPTGKVEYSWKVEEGAT